MYVCKIVTSVSKRETSVCKKMISLCSNLTFLCENLTSICRMSRLCVQWRRDARSGSIDLLKFEREIQVTVTINSNWLLNRAPFYHFYSGLRK